MSVQIFYRGVQIASNSFETTWLEYYGRMHAQRHLESCDPSRLQWLEDRLGDDFPWHVDIIPNPPPIAGIMRSPNSGPEVLLRAHIVFEDPKLAMLYRLTWQ